MPANIPNSKFAVSGNWKFNNESAELVSGQGKIKLNFGASKVYMVAQSSASPITLRILVDGQFTKEVTVSGSELYSLFESDEYKNRTLEIEIPNSGLEAFTFTFG